MTLLASPRLWIAAGLLFVLALAVAAVAVRSPGDGFAPFDYTLF